MKKCSKCNIEKPITDFYSNKARSTKTYSRCIPCEKESIKTFKSKELFFDDSNLSNEVWKYVILDNKVYPYLISNYGRVKIAKTNKLAKPSLDQRGYPQIVLSKDGVRLSRRLHRIVATNYIDNPLNKREVNHINGNKEDNSVYNLEWVTSKENISHALINNLR
jgi:hypothetical protein